MPRILQKFSKEAIARVRAAKKKPIASLFDLPKKSGRIKTEILFIERCLALLKPGGRMGIVLPEGIFNNPSLAYVREYVEARAFIRAVISLPQETFHSADTSVKASLLFLQKFTEQEQDDFDEKKAQARTEVEAKYQDEIAKCVAAFETEIKVAKNDKQKCVELTKELKSYQREMSVKIDREARALLKERFDYSIFLYGAEKVGITATGEEDQNELYPNPNVTPGVEKTAIEQYLAFRETPGEFLLAGAMA